VVRYLKLESESLQRGFEIVRSIDEKRSVLTLLFLAEFTEKQHGEVCGLRLEQPDAKEFVGFWIDSGIQPILLIIESDHGLVNRDAIRPPVRFRL